MGDVKKPGSLVVVDQFFSPMPMMGIGGPVGPVEAAHGHVVSETAKGDGYSGNLVPSELENKFPGAAFQIGQALNQEGVPAEEFIKRLDMSINLQSVSLLESMADRLEGLKEAGLHHSAVNLSYGAGQANTLKSLYGEVRMAWSGWGPVQDFKKPLVENYARAFDLDSTKLLDSDPKISGPERVKLQQALADRIATTSENSDAIKESRQHYSQAVRELEGEHNSVVVSASNYGEIEKQLSQDAGGSTAALKLSPKFYDNALATPETTVVGATVGSGPEEKVAGYSSDFAGVSIYANGVAPMPMMPGEDNAQGTSFASPRVAGVMAQLHELYPEKSSAEIESMLKEEMSHQLLSYDGHVERPVLNDHASMGMLSRYT